MGIEEAKKRRQPFVWRMVSAAFVLNKTHTNKLAPLRDWIR